MNATLLGSALAIAASIGGRQSATQDFQRACHALDLLAAAASQSDQQASKQEPFPQDVVAEFDAMRKKFGPRFVTPSDGVYLPGVNYERWNERMVIRYVIPVFEYRAYRANPQDLAPLLAAKRKELGPQTIERPVGVWTMYDDKALLVYVLSDIIGAAHKRGDDEAVTRAYEAMPLDRRWGGPVDIVSDVYERQGRFEDARKAMERNMNLDPSSGRGPFTDRTYQARYAELCRRTGHLDEADKWYRRAATNTYYYTGQGQVRLVEDDDRLQGEQLRLRALCSGAMALSEFAPMDSSDRLIRTAMEIDPTSPWVWLAKARKIEFVDGYVAGADLAQAEYHSTGDLRKQIHDLRTGWWGSWWDGRLLTMPGENPPNPPTGFDIGKYLRSLRDKTASDAKREKEQAAAKARNSGG